MSDEHGIEKIDLAKVDWKSSREFFESLGDALDQLDDKDESYDFTWVGKRKAIIEAGAPISKTLRPDVENSKNWDTTENLFIEGDNLDALKLLQESYLGKVKMIYIDPPYNTGKDFVYHDNFKANVEEYDEATEYKDEAGNIQFKKNEKSNGRYHSDWLSMMYPRLKLARNLLSEDGVIFISIDDNEQANLKKLCDEVFGEDNYRNTIAVRRRVKSLNSQFSEDGLKTLNVGFEYVLVYAKNDSYLMPALHVKKINASSKGRWDVFWSGADRPTMRYELLGFTPQTGQWRNSKEKALQGVENFRKYEEEFSDAMTLEEYSEKTGITKFIRRTKPGSGKNGGVQHWVAPASTSLRSSSWLDLEVSQIHKEIDLPFDNPKNRLLIQEIIKLGGLKKDDLILDFFSGSATTAHAVMQLNAEDGGNRKWIMVQLPEETDEKSEAYKAGYKTIPEISRERIRRAGNKIAEQHPDAKVDYGFRALRIDDANMKDVYRPASEVQQSMLDHLVDNVKEDRSDLDLLYGVLTATALELNRPLETVELDGVTIYKYDYFSETSGLIACFADEIIEEAIKQIAQLKPLIAVFKEGSFPNSQAKVNLAEHFRVLSPETKVKVI